MKLSKNQEKVQNKKPHRFLTRRSKIGIISGISAVIGLPFLLGITYVLVNNHKKTNSNSQLIIIRKEIYKQYLRSLNLIHSLPDYGVFWNLKDYFEKRVAQYDFKKKIVDKNEHIFSQYIEDKQDKETLAKISDDFKNLFEYLENNFKQYLLFYNEAFNLIINLHKKNISKEDLIKLNDFEDILYSNKTNNIDFKTLQLKFDEIKKISINDK